MKGVSMKKILKAQEPTELQHYKHTNPQATWSQFRKNKTRYNAVKNQIKKDQGALCAYCEIDLKESVKSNDDFRVEHFHPKNDNSAQINWALEWSNVLGCCHGGSERNVVDAKQRFTSSAERHCDVPKKGKNLSGVILSPLQIPAFPLLFDFDRFTGEMSINTMACSNANISISIAESTIRELCLNATVLKIHRKDVLNSLNDEIKLLIGNGKTIMEAMDYTVKAVLRKDSNGNFPAFFSTIRSYLKSTAETHLKVIGYNG